MTWCSRAGPAGTLGTRVQIEDEIVELRKELLEQGLDAGAHTIAVHYEVERVHGPSDADRRHHHAISLVSGVVLMGVGVLLLTGLWTQLLSPVLRVVNRFEPPI